MGQLLLCTLKSVPVVSETLVIVMAALELLVNVAVCSGLVTFTNWFPKLTAAGDKSAAGVTGRVNCHMPRP